MSELCFNIKFNTTGNIKSNTLFKKTHINPIKPIKSLIKKDKDKVEFETWDDYWSDIFDFMHQMMQNTNIPINNRPYRPKVIINNIEDLRRLQQLLKTQKARILPGIQKKFVECVVIRGMDDIPQYVFNATLTELDSRYSAYIKNKKKIYQSYNITPFQTPGFARAFSVILELHPEFNDSIAQYGCGKGISNTKKLNVTSKNSHCNQNCYECIYIPNSIYHLYTLININLESNSNNADFYYIINSKEYKQSGTESYTLYDNNNKLVEYYDPYKHMTTVAISAKDIMNVSMITSAFQGGGVMLIHPRLALLTQIQFPDLWRSPYYNTALNYKNHDQVDIIVILTLQKYAAIRRYMWSKDPVYTSAIYKVDPKIIAAELRDIYSLIPYEANDESQTHEDIPWKIIPYSKEYIQYAEFKDSDNEFKEYIQYAEFKDFDNEFKENQKWLLNGKLRYTSIDDPNLKNILPVLNVQWCLIGEYKPIEQVKIKRIPEFEKFIENPEKYKKNIQPSIVTGGKSLKFETRCNTKRNRIKRNRIKRTKRKTKKWIRSR